MENELYHVYGFKYVKRVWKNGKWQYYYDNGKGTTRNLGLVSKISDWVGEDEKQRANVANQNSRYAKRTEVDNARVYNAALDKYYKDSGSAISNDLKYRDRKRTAQYFNELDRGVKSDRRYGSDTNHASKDFAVKAHAAASARRNSMLNGKAAKQSLEDVNAMELRYRDIQAYAVLDSKYVAAIANQKYDQTILGKVEKGANWVKNLFSKK